MFHQLFVPPMHASLENKHPTVKQGNRSGNCWEQEQPSPRGSNKLEGSGVGGVDEGRFDDDHSRALPLEDSDHLAVHCVHMFTQNLYHYATQNTVRREREGDIITRPYLCFSVSCVYVGSDEQCYGTLIWAKC